MTTRKKRTKSTKKPTKKNNSKKRKLENREYYTSLMIRGKKRRCKVIIRNGKRKIQLLDNLREKRKQYLDEPISMEEAKKIFRSQSKRAQSMDLRKTSKHLLETPTRRWALYPGKYDVKGIDTYLKRSSSSSSPSKPKTKKKKVVQHKEIRLNLDLHPEFYIYLTKKDIKNDSFSLFYNAKKDTWYFSVMDDERVTAMILYVSNQEKEKNLEAFQTLLKKAGKDKKENVSFQIYSTISKGYLGGISISFGNNKVLKYYYDSPGTIDFSEHVIFPSINKEICFRADYKKFIKYFVSLARTEPEQAETIIDLKNKTFLMIYTNTLVEKEITDIYYLGTPLFSVVNIPKDIPISHQVFSYNPTLIYNVIKNITAKSISSKYIDISILYEKDKNKNIPKLADSLIFLKFGVQQTLLIAPRVFFDGTNEDEVKKEIKELIKLNQLFYKEIINPKVEKLQYDLTKSRYGELFIDLLKNESAKSLKQAESDTMSGEDLKIVFKKDGEMFFSYLGNKFLMLHTTNKLSKDVCFIDGRLEDFRQLIKLFVNKTLYKSIPPILLLENKENQKKPPIINWDLMVGFINKERLENGNEYLRSEPILRNPRLLSSSEIVLSIDFRKLASTKSFRDLILKIPPAKKFGLIITLETNANKTINKIGKIGFLKRLPKSNHRYEFELNKGYILKNNLNKLFKMEKNDTKKEKAKVVIRFNEKDFKGILLNKIISIDILNIFYIPVYDSYGHDLKLFAIQLVNKDLKENNIIMLVSTGSFFIEEDEFEFY